MTEQEIQTLVAQAQQDAMMLDYTRWSADRRGSKLPTDHDIWVEQRDRVLARQRSENTEARRKREASYNTAKAERNRQDAAAIDAELEPQKQALMRDWLANHPGNSAADFNTIAWPHLRANLIEERAATVRQAGAAEAQASGRYSL